MTRYFLGSLLLAISVVAANAATDNPAHELVTKYCVSCHNQKLKTAGLALDRADADNPYNSQETWEKVIVKLRSRAMPPPKLPRPDNATYDKAAGLAWNPKLTGLPRPA